MRSNPFLFLLVLSITLAACNRSAVNLTYTNAKEEVEPLQNLVFTFDKPLAPDSLAAGWDSTPYIDFSPAIRGRYRWEKPDRLVFSPAEPLMPATQYKARFESALLRHTKFGRVGHADAIRFHTPALQLESVLGRWVASAPGSSQAVAELDLFFNYEVDPQALSSKLNLKLEKNAYAFKMQTLSPGKKVTLRIPDLRPEDRDLEVNLTIDKGMTARGSQSPSAEPIVQQSTLSSPFNLTINEVSSEHDGTQGSIYVRTSQQVVADGLASQIVIDPSVKFTVAPSEDGFVITGDGFNVEKSYSVLFKKGIRGNIGGVLKEDRTDQVAFGQLEPAIRFTNSKAVFLSSRGNALIEMRITNVSRIRLVISKIYESNLMAATKYGYYPEDGGGEDEYAYEQSSNASDLVLGDIVFEKDIETASLPKYGKSRLLKFNVEDQLPDFKGIYHIKVRSADDYWVSDSRFISKSDIGLIARQGESKMVVFANSIRTASSLQGVNLAVYGANNQLVGIGSTNEAGMAEISYAHTTPSGFRPSMIIAKSPDDFNYLPLNTTQVNTSRFDVGGKRSNPSGLDAFVYEERDLYRPGETIHFSVILRDAKWESPGELPVIFKFLLPTGKEYRTFRKTLNKEGSAEGSLDLPASALTGTYTLEVYSGNQVLLASKGYSVEEFVPDRLRLTTRSDRLQLKPGQTVSMTVHADNFFGPPAANRKFESEIQVQAKAFNPKGYEQYDFNIRQRTVTFDKQISEGTTNESGEAEVTFKAPELYRNMGLLQATNYFTVFDETGRPVSRSIQLDIVTQDIFWGIGNDGNSYFPLNQVVRFPLVAVNYEGRPMSASTAEVRVIKHEYRTVLTKSGSLFRYESQQEDRIVAEQNVVVSSAKSFFPFVPRSPGEYEIRVSVPGSNSYVSREFYSYGSWGGETSSFEVNNEGQVDITSDKDTYQAGEKAKLLFKAPFNGRLLVTMEQDNLLSYQYLEVKNRNASMELPLEGRHLPNLYITATLIKPHTVSDIPLTVAHGFKSLRVEEPNRKLGVAIRAATSSRSLKRQRIEVNSAPNSLVTLAVVDNGVLQVTDYQTPDPYRFFYARRALGVLPYDLYPLLFPELKAVLSSTGGDGDLDMNKRTNPMPAKRVHIVSYWSGIRKADGSGKAFFDIDIPAFSGELRLMAVSYNGNAFGHSETTMKVADPVVLSMAAPRFMSPGDTVSVSAILMNTTSSAINLNTSLQATGALAVGGGQPGVLVAPAGGEATARFQVTAGKNIGTGSLRIVVRDGRETYTDTIEMSVRPAVPNLVRSGSGSLNGGENLQLKLPVDGFIPSGINYQLIIGRSPAADLGRQLKYLVQYPFGCTEQIVSAAFPQLYLDDLARQFRQAGIPAPRERIQEAIRIIKMRQLYNGGLMLWESGTEHWWASAYATHFLLEAQQAGYDVDERLLGGLLTYLKSRLRKKETVSYFYNRDQQRRIAPKEVAYSLYVLALAGRANLPVMNYYKANNALLSLDSRYMLSASYALGGDRRSFRELLPASFSGEESVPETGGSFYSDIRDEAIALDVMLKVDPTNAQVPEMARHVVQKLQQRTWFSTQEAAFGLLALGKLARQQAGATVTGDIVVNGKKVTTVGDQAIRLDARQLGGSSLSIQTKGKGKLYYSWQAEGVSADGSFKEEDRYLRVRRRFYDRQGKLISGNQFKQNEIVIVEVSVEKAAAGDIKNVVATDMLPAGFEIENPRTKEIPGMDWIKNASEPLSLDVRDDRINIFLDLNRSKQVYYYAVRAVTPGRYTLGPVSAEAMYNGEYHSYNGGGSIIIE